MKRYLSAILMALLLLTAIGCGSSQIQTNETTADTAQTESVSAVTTEPMESEDVTTDTEPVTEPPAETDTSAEQPTAAIELHSQNGESQEDIIIGTVIYTENDATNEIPTNIGYEDYSVHQWQSDWFYGDVGYKIIRGSAAARLEQLLTACQTTGETAPKLSDVTVDRLDEIKGSLPCERGTLWFEFGENIYRKLPNEANYVRVDGYFGAGEYLAMDEQSRAEISAILNYWPFDYYSGTYENGILTVRHVYHGDSSLSAVITGIQIDKKEGENNVITLALTPEYDMQISLYLNIEVSSDHLLDGDIVSLDLKAGQMQTVELPYMGFTNEYHGYTDGDYWIDIDTENIRIYLHIDP